MPNKPHIAIVAKGGHNWLGGRQYTINILRALTQFRPDRDAYDVSVFVDRQDELSHFEDLRPSLRHCDVLQDYQRPFSLANRARWKVKRTTFGWINPRLEEMLQRVGATFAYPVTSAKIPSADWIPDFQYLHFPDGSNQTEIAGRKLDFARIVQNAQRVVLSSRGAEADCQREFPQSAGRTFVLRFRAFASGAWTAQDPDTVRRHYHLPERFALVSNHLIPTKNHGVILAALAKIPATAREAVHIVCTGDIFDYRNPGFYNGFLSGIHELGLQRNIHLLGMVPKSHQMQLLRRADLYLQPSLFEGWNTGVEEAHLLGRPMILSDIAVHREQNPPNASFFPPRDADALALLLAEAIAPGAGTGTHTQSEAGALDSYKHLQRQFAQEFVELAGIGRQALPASQERAATIVVK